MYTNILESIIRAGGKKVESGVKSEAPSLALGCMEIWAKSIEVGNVIANANAKASRITFFYHQFSLCDVIHIFTQFISWLSLTYFADSFATCLHPPT